MIQLSLASNTESYFPKASCPSETLNKNKIYPKCETNVACLGLLQSGRFYFGPRLLQGAGGRGRCSEPGSGGGAAHSFGPLSARTAGSSHFFQPPAGSGLDSDCSADHRDADLAFVQSCSMRGKRQAAE